MDVKFEKLNDVKGEIIVTLEEKDYLDKVEKRLKEIGKTAEIKGFRKGHVPAGKIKSQYGAAVKYDIVNKEIGDAVFNYIKENKLNVLAQPVADKENVYNENDKDFVFKFEVGLVPEIDTHVDKNLHVPYYEIKVTEEMIDEELKALQQRLGHQVSGEKTEPNAVIKGVISELNPDGTVKEDGIVVENGILSPIHFTDEEQKKLFEGKHKGDVVVFNPSVAAGNNIIELSSMLNIDRKDVENHKGDFNFEITDIIVLKPAEMDQEFFDQAVGKDKVHNEQELRSELKSLLERTLANDSNYKFSIDAKDEILKAIGKVELPDEILKDFLIKQNEGLNKNNIDEEYVKIIPQLVWDLAKNKLIEQLNVKVEQQDIINEANGVVIRQLSQYGSNMLTEQLINHYSQELLKDEKNRQSMINNALNRKMYDAIKETVTLDKKPVSLEEFREIVNPSKA